MTPVLFNIFINDFYGVKCIFPKFTDDTKLVGIADSLKIQKASRKGTYIDQNHWAICNSMKFIKCWILLLELSNIRHTYSLGRKWLERSPAERDLGTLVDSWLNMSQQHTLAAKKESSNVEYIKLSIAKQSKGSFSNYI